MSLKTKLRISIVTLVTALVLMQCVVSLRIAAEANFREALERAQGIASQVRHLVLQRVNEKAAAEQPSPATLAETVRLWHRIVEEDEALPSLLEKTMASSNAVIEILVCDEAGRILASSSPARIRLTYQSLPDFNQWKERPVWDRVLEVLSETRDYAIVVPLGATQAEKPALTIRVVVSSVLIRNAILPQVRSLLAVSVLSLLASVLLAFLFSNVVLRSLDRLSQRIASIAAGSFAPEESPPREAKEFADMQSKLDVLSQQYRGAKEDVHQLRQNIERMLERLEEGVLLFGPDGRLLQASRSAERLLGLPRARMAGLGLDELFPASDPVGAVIREARGQHKAVRDTLVLVERPGAAPVKLLVNVELLEGFPELGQSSLLLALRDAETRRQIRSQLDISTRLAAISRLTGGVAHEIKNPLNAMALHLEILKSKVDANEDVRNEVEVIGGEIARLDRVVKTFLDFTRPVEIRMGDVRLAELARRVAALVWPEAQRSRVTVAVEAPDESVTIRGDEDLLKQALLNVVNNGMEAMKEGGRLLIRVDREGEEAIASVRDQGPGIPDELHEKIFNLYFSTKQKGSGIGLAMTFRIVQLHNASIDFTSSPEQGTTFYLRFPAVEESGVDLEAAASERLGP